ncbi:NAD-dependent epimerase/dehydratase family protein [Halovibrio sp. HP20-50]|uniref:NAD-dependent epimerase/dehydratase family protein n=1 Tax=Halovibrio sp. HP20-59 TaxID=3080275 RepID=UPI00294B5D83|nr:NAD-dependent epimerase/dehydratase family protein [Halovibrio sp. HP20-59]MEA2120097.1 GDP-mannose 4,6-dehydratase [Halovibrio sp. HP20-59]
MHTSLVTGGSGFTGRHLIAHLKAQGRRVVALASEPCGADTHHAISLDDHQALDALIQQEVPQHVYHLAALSFVGHPEPLDFYRVNVLGTDTLLAALARLETTPRVLLASSANVYGANARGAVHEQVPPAPVNHYAASKLAMEHLARTYASRLPMLIARPFNYTGPGQAEHFLVPKIVSHFRRRAETLELGNIDVKRDFSDVRDIVASYAMLLDQWPGQAHSGDVVNLGSGHATALTDVLVQLEALSGHTLDISVNPAFVRLNEIPELKADITRLHAWCPAVFPRPLRETLSDMLAS